MIPPLFLLKHSDIALDCLSGVIVLVQCIFVIGLRTLGTNMIDPYGEDLEDLSVITYVEDTLKFCYTIMNSKHFLNEKPVAKFED